MASRQIMVICEYGGKKALPELLKESFRLFALRSLASGRADVVSSSPMNDR